MGHRSSATLKLVPLHCELLQQDMWVMSHRPVGGTWRAVVCLNRSVACIGSRCALFVEAWTRPQDTPGSDSINDDAGRA